MSRFEGRIAVITGAARGLGRAAALRLSSEGAHIGIVDVADASQACEEIRSNGGVAEAWRCDVTDEEQVEHAFKGVDERFGRIDVLVNNAGILAPRKPWHTWAKEEIERYIDINYIGYFLCARAAYPLLKRSAHGRIINVASRTFYMGNPGQLPYVASKGAVQGLTWNLARELGDEGITVNAVMPGMVPTEGTLEYNGPEAYERVMQNQALKKQVLPEHLAALIAFLASDDAEMITGQSIICDGGGLLH